MKKISGKICAAIVISVSLFSFASAESFLGDAKNHFSLDLPAAWQKKLEMTDKDFTVKPSKYDNGMSRYYFSEKSGFSLQLLSADYQWTYFLIGQNIFSESAPQYDDLSDLCKKPGVIRDAQSWNTPGTFFSVCALQEIDEQPSFLLYEFLAYPEASGYGVVARSFVKLSDGSYAGAIFSIPLKKISKSIGRLMPYESDEPEVYEKKMNRGKLSAKKYLKRLMKKSLPGIPRSDKEDLALLLQTLGTFQELEMNVQ